MKKIVIIGAGQFQNPLIRKAKEMGLETHVFAWQIGDPGEYSADYFYPINITNHDAICRECRRIQPVAVVSGASDLATHTVGYVARELGLVSNSQKAIALTTNKLCMRRALERAGCPQPAFLEVNDRVLVEDIRALGYPLVIKPSDRSGGRSVVRVDSEQQMFQAAGAARDVSFEHKAIVERYIAGRYYSAETISFQGSHHVLAITENEVVESDGSFYEVGHRQPANLWGGLAQTLKQLTHTVLDTLGVTVGAAHTEFVVTPEGKAYIIEVSGSMAGDYIGSDLVTLSTGIDYLQIILEVAQGRTPELVQTAQRREAEVRFLTCAGDVERWNKCRLANGRRIVQSCMYEGSRTLGLQPGRQRYGHYITAQRPKEMGGYLPLELGKGRDYFRDIPSAKLRRLNSGRAAIWYAVRSLMPKRVHVPYFCNPAVAGAIREAGAETVYFNIGEDFLPVEVQPGEGDAVLLVNFCGLLDEAVQWYAKAHPDWRLIVDNAGAFFCPPILRDGVYNVYSSRKFVGVPDGGYLVGSPLADIVLADDYSAPQAGFLLQSLELGTNGAYQMSLNNERLLGQRYLRMSELTFRMLDSADYKRIQALRRENYTYLHRMLGERNLLRLELRDGVPQYYPFLCERNIRDSLLKQRVYLPVLWRKCLDPEFEGSIEQRYAGGICCLPIDQRYGEEDMEYLSGLVLDALR